jgi:phage terminase large subunit GpA-like protein
MDMIIPQSRQTWTDYAIPGAKAIRDAYQRVAIVRRYRSMGEFAESEIILPDGPFAGLPFRATRQPAHGAFFREIDSGNWFRYACTGPQQSGKTLSFVVIPILYHLFERNQTVLFGLPSMDMANDKWKLDIKPAIEASQFAKFMPRKGSGSQGGTPELIQFSNGSNLKFITAGGGDEKRAGFTGPILVVTEVSHLDQVGANSDEATKLKQMEGRVRAYRASGQARIYLESTVTVEEGRIWQEYQNGTAGEVVFQCHSCDEWISPGRDNLIGWQDAATEDEAEINSRWACPCCGIVFDDTVRLQQLRNCKVRHKGQTILKDGTVAGQIVPSKTMGFRYSAGTNTFVTAGIVGADEWKGKREIDQDNAEKELLQWTWALPAKPSQESVEPLDFKTVMFRQSQWKRGTMPSDVQIISAGVDVRDKQLDWFVTAKRKNGQPICIDYGFQLVHKEMAGDLPTAIRQAIRELMEKFEAGWLIENTDKLRGVDIALIDVGYETDTVRDTVAESQTWRRAQGFGYQQHAGSKYSSPAKGRLMHNIGEGWHDVILTRNNKRFRELQNDSDHWKRRVHQSLSVAADSGGALLLPKSDKPDGRMEVAKQLTAEKEITSFEVGRGNVRKWVKTFSRNHLLDAAYMSFVGISVFEFEIAKAKKLAENTVEKGVISGKKAEPFVRKRK